MKCLKCQGVNYYYKSFLIFLKIRVKAFTAFNTFLRQFERLEAHVLSGHFEEGKRIINPILEYFWPMYRLESIRSRKVSFVYLRTETNDFKCTYGNFSMKFNIDLSLQTVPLIIAAIVNDYQKVEVKMFGQFHFHKFQLPSTPARFLTP